MEEVDELATKDTFRIATAEEVEAGKLDGFLRDYFLEQHCDFLRDYGFWHHRGDRQRLIVLSSSGQIVGYSAVIPITVWLADREMEAIFWVDLYVAPEWRGKGIQRLTDQAVSRMAGLKLGFPNELAAAIHRKHGWGVREDYRMLMLPLVPHKVPRIRAAVGGKGTVLKGAAQLARPVAWLYRRSLQQYRPARTQILEEPDAQVLAEVFLRHRDGWVTANRNDEHIRWRYLESPFRPQYTFFVGGMGSTPSLAAVSRTFDRGGVAVTRILDIFGDLDDREGLSDMLRLVAREAIRQGASQITVAATDPSLASTLRANGFLFSTNLRFCWLSRDPEVMRAFDDNRNHWVLADSDNDLAG